MQKNLLTVQYWPKVILFFIIVLLMLTGAGALEVRADTTANYTGVLEDMQKDPSFRAEDYPVVAGDNTVQVITLAESTNGELFIYAYHPGGEPARRPATSINISTALNDSLFYQNYTLKQLSVSGSLAKYVVNGFEVKSDVMRYYSISSIFRAWDKTIDSEPGAGNKVVEVSYAVGKLFTATTLDGEVSYTCTEEEVITITDKYVGYVRYYDGFYLWKGDWCDSHFVAFSTDHDIDKLLEADVEWIEKSHDKYVDDLTINPGFVPDDVGDPVKMQETLTYTDVGENDGSGLFGKKYIWDRIQSVKEFVDSEELTAEAKQELSNKQWVLRFRETEFIKSDKLATGHRERYTEVSEVTILRLKFETAGKVYNLGVVDNKQTGSLLPVGGPINKDNDWFKIFILVVSILLTLFLVIWLFYKIFCKEK